MSECVVRMEMPKKCVNCLAWCICGTIHKYMLGIDCDSDWTYDDLLVLTDETGFIKPDDCPIICQLPEGHGRLVDGDELYMTVKTHDTKRIVNLVLRSGFMEEKRICLHDICQAPTIVPAEAERSET